VFILLIDRVKKYQILDILNFKKMYLYVAFALPVHVEINYPLESHLNDKLNLRVRLEQLCIFYPEQAYSKI
jgi:hypothetical protein